jgi:sulfite exporter TauE/SafE
LSVLTSDSTTLLPLAILSASLAGSLHCVSMCGGLMASVASSRASQVSYHLGRLLGYATLGALAGALGQSVLSLSGQRWIVLTSGIAMGLLFIAMGYSCWRTRGFHLWTLSKEHYARIFRVRAPWLVGLGTAALPCGWLQMFVVGAIATQSPLKGAAYMALFWVGTLPALSFAQVLLRQVLRPLASRAPLLVALVLVSAGLANISSRVWEFQWTQGNTHASHGSSPEAQVAAEAEAHGSHSCH